MVQTAKELLVAITPIDDAEVHAFVEYLEWMKSTTTDDMDFPLSTPSDPDNPDPDAE